MSSKVATTVKWWTDRFVTTTGKNIGNRTRYRRFFGNTKYSHRYLQRARLKRKKVNTVAKQRANNGLSFTVGTHDMICRSWVK